MSAQTLDAHHDQKTSTTFMALHHVEAQEDECQLAVTILQSTNSGGHKFKVCAAWVRHLGFSLNSCWS